MKTLIAFLSSCVLVLAIQARPIQATEVNIAPSGIPSADSNIPPLEHLNDGIHPPLPYADAPPWVFSGPSGAADPYVAMNFFTGYGHAARWIGYEFNTDYDVTRAVLLPYASTSGYSHYYPIDYEIQKSDDGAIWETIVSVTGNNQPVIDHTFAPVSTNHIRLSVTEAFPWPSPGGTRFRLGATEFEVYADITCSSVLDGAVQVAENGATINATFTPNFGLSLQDACEICQVDHFNWTNRLKEHPESWDIIAVDRTRVDPLLGNPIFLRNVDETRVFDPYINHPGEDGNNAILTASGEILPIQSFGYQWDEKPPYRQEKGAAGLGTGGHIDDSNVTVGDEKLVFYDQPSFTLQDHLLPSDTIRHYRFVTRLVGVDSDGNIVEEWANLRTNFAWSTDGQLVGNVVRFSATENDVLPTIAGGVFDIEFDPIPEPTTLLLSLLGLAAVGICRRRNSRV